MPQTVQIAARSAQVVMPPPCGVGEPRSGVRRRPMESVLRLHRVEFLELVLEREAESFQQPSRGFVRGLGDGDQ
jgi:hypothetical protein